MVNHLEDYKTLLQQGINVYDELIQLYEPDKQVDKDWADITLMQTRNQRNSLAESMNAPVKLSIAYTSTLILSIGQYLDTHWADYQEFPTVNIEKRALVEQLHAKLEAIVKGIARIDLALR